MESKYYKVHCPCCGNVMYASDIGFNIGEIICHATNNSGDSQWQVLKNIDLKVYLNEDDLAPLFDKKNNTFILGTHFIKERLKKIYGKDSVEQIKDYARDIDQLEALVSKVKKEGKEVDLELKVNFLLLLDLCDEISSNEKLLSFQIEYKNDDKGQRFPYQLSVTYNNGNHDNFDTVCTKCGKPLFALSGIHQEYIIGMVGTSNVGKTTYLNSLISVLEKNNEANNDFVMKKSNDIYWQDFENIKDYFLFMLEIAISNKKYNFIFVDMPGRIYNDVETNFIENEKKIMKNVDIIYYCLSSDQISSNYLLNNFNKTGGGNINDDMMEVVSRITETIKVIPEIENKKTAVLITKSDLIKDNYCKPINIGDIYIDSYLNEKNWLDYSKLKSKNIDNAFKYIKNSQNILTNFKGNFNYFQIFLISSFNGKLDFNNPNKEKYLQSTVIVPFVWSLAMLKLLDSKIGRSFPKDKKIDDIKELCYKENSIY